MSRRIQSYAFRTFLAISSQPPFPRSTNPEATQIASRVEFNLLQCDAGEGWAHRIPEARATAFPERTWDQPALRIPSDSHALGSVKKAASQLGFPRGGELQELRSQHLLPSTSTPFQHARPILTSVWKMEIVFQSTTQAACSPPFPDNLQLKNSSGGSKV